jgi:hypothetical protein
MLAEAFLGALAATVLTAFMNGFFGEIGKGFGEKLRKRPFRKAELVETEPEVLIAELARRIANGELDTTKFNKDHAEVNRVLVDLGVAKEHSAMIANQVRKVMEHHSHGE